jgi:hypothetical protein
VSRNSLSYFITFGFLSLLVSGCGGDAPKPSNSASPSPSVSAAIPAPVPSVAPIAATSPGVTSSPVVAKTLDGKLVAGSDIAAGLIPVSDMETATKAVSKGRVDPFSAVIAYPVAPRAAALQPRTQPAAPNTPAAPVATTPVKTGSGLGAAGVATIISNKKNPGKIIAKALPPAAKIKPGIVGSIPATTPLVPVQPGKVALLTPPVAAPVIEPTLAKSIQVFGVSEINGQVQVIVKLPGESFSRYISVGEKVLNGKVLIKRVQDRNAIAPIVVLEEVGVEVLRKVGEKPLVAAKDAVKETAEPAK